jgi:uncharacterized protein YraI
MKRRGCQGCLLLVLVAVALVITTRNDRPKQGGEAPPTGFTEMPNPATADALQGTAHIAALTATVTPSATITDTVAAPTATITPTAPAAGIQADTNAVDMTAFTPTSYMVRSTANARSCPDTQCPSLGKLQAGDTIIVDGGGHGGDFKGSNVWVRTNINGQVAYVHSSLVIEAALVSQPQQVQSTIPPVVSVPITNPLIYQCDGIDNLNCSDFASGGADEHLKACGRDEDHLDKEPDGDACEPGFN